MVNIYPVASFIVKASAFIKTTADKQKDRCASGWQIIKKEKTKMNISLARLPPLILDWLGPDYATKEELLLRGYDLPCYP